MTTLNSFQVLTLFTKNSILDVAGVLDLLISIKVAIKHANKIGRDNVNAVLVAGTHVTWSTYFSNKIGEVLFTCLPDNNFTQNLRNLQKRDKKEILFTENWIREKSQILLAAWSNEKGCNTGFYLLKCRLACFYKICKKLSQTFFCHDDNIHCSNFRMFTLRNYEEAITCVFLHARDMR